MSASYYRPIIMGDQGFWAISSLM